MRAAVYQGGQRFSIDELPTPSPEPGQVLIKVNMCAICGTDVHAFLYDIAPPGTVLGHEYCGVIVEVGSEITRWKVGDRVIGGGGEPPAGSEPAVRAEPRFNYRTMGFPEGSIRGYAEYIAMDEWQPLAVPDGVPDEAAAMCEPSAVAVHAVRKSRVRVGDSVGVIGAGPIGLLVAQVARAAGASKVMISEPTPGRKAAAMSIGCDAVFDPTEQDVEREMVAMTNGLGPDVVFDCAGIKGTLDQAFNIVRRAGEVVLVAVPWEEMPVRAVDWMARETEFKASWGSLPSEWPVALNMMAKGQLSMASLILEQSYVPLEGIQAAFEALVKPSSQVQMVVRL
ncbi:MAG: zinc-binding dehydrogenase [Chloroflexi bacterium]|nr:zinc-binding dehydrogenase [Chloroflexota bacterium]